MKILHLLFPHLKKRAEFKKKIEGFFDSWKISKYYAIKAEYGLWIANGYDHFKDEGPYRLLNKFKEWERRLLWEEVKKARAEFSHNDREQINKEFNL
jgi:hypothetical protein